MKTGVCFVLSLLLFLILLPTVYSSLRINEIYPAPQVGENEWVELYNDGLETLDLTKYTVTDLTNKKINFNDLLIYSNSFSIATSSGVLNNTGDTVFLKKTSGETLQIATYSGSFSFENSYVSCPDGSESFFILNKQTKNFSNDIACFDLSPSPTKTPTPTPTPSPTREPTTTPTKTPTPTSTPTVVPSLTPTPTLKPTDYNNIFISEAMVYPDTNEKEWVELYNDNDFEVNLENWYLDDIAETGSTPKLFSLTISAKNYNSVELSSSIFNNSKDNARVLNFEKTEKDAFEYSESTKGLSIGRVSFENDFFCIQNSSRNSANTACILSNSPTSTPYKINTPTPYFSKPISTKTTTQSLVKNKITPFFSNKIRASFMGSSSIPSREILEEQPVVLGAETTSLEDDAPDLIYLQYLRFFSLNSMVFSLFSSISLYIRAKTYLKK